MKHLPAFHVSFSKHERDPGFVLKLRHQTGPCSLGHSLQGLSALTALCLWALIAGLLAFKSRALLTTSRVRKQAQSFSHGGMSWRCLSNCSFLEEPGDTFHFGVIKRNPLIREQKDKQMKEKNPDGFFFSHWVTWKFPSKIFASFNFLKEKWNIYKSDFYWKGILYRRCLIIKQQI